MSLAPYSLRVSGLNLLDTAKQDGRVAFLWKQTECKRGNNRRIAGRRNGLLLRSQAFCGLLRFLDRVESGIWDFL